jgi:adenylate cyclase
LNIDSLLSFLPIDRRHSLAYDVAIPRKAMGSVFFADISGFTPLTEALARDLGARLGAEELTRTLNRVYDALVQPVHTLGGTIINFSGDAITGWFDGGGDPEAAALRALTCAFRLQAAMNAFERVKLPNGSAANLSIKVAVASGAVQRYLVGDPAYLQMDVLAGATLKRMAQGEHHAGRGEVVCDETTVELLAQRGGVSEWRESDEGRFAVIDGLTEVAPDAPWAELPPDALTAEQVHPWIIPALWDHEDVSLTELRPAVALFAAFNGIDYDDDPDAESKLDAYIRWAQSVLGRYDGTLLQVSAGDKGSHFYAAFGAPTAHENNAERAASAALRLRNLPRELNYIKDVRIGIAQGIMRTGAYGGSTRRVYGVIGDDVNIAARLMMRAHLGMILVSESVQKAVEASHVTSSLEAIRVKGKQEALPVFRLVAKTDESEIRPLALRPLVGRASELRRLMAAVLPLTAQPPQNVGATWVYGDAGIGKTHLINAVRERLATLVEWYRFPSDSLVHESLHAIMPMLHEYFSFFLAINDILKKKLFERRIDRLLRSLSDETMIAAVSEARWYLGALMGLHWQGSPYENADPYARFERSLNAINTLFQAESVIKPLVIHVQDAQWLDADSRAVVELWIESAKRFPMAVLIDSREVDTDLAERHNVTLFPLREMDRAGVEALAKRALKGALSAGTVDYLMNKANGNPFFTEQIALDLLERGALSLSAANEWSVSEREVDDMPVNINAVLIARLDRLSTAVRVTVQIASVLGQEFELPVLQHMTHDDETTLRQKVKQAADETIWVAQSESVYVFRHALLRDAAYSMQLTDRLRRLHALAGAAIERIHAENLTVKAPDLAYHYEKSGIPELAVFYLVKSAEYMLSLHAHHEALGYYERALELAENAQMPPLDIAQIYEGLGDMHEAAGEYQPAADDYHEALHRVPDDRTVWRTTLHRKRGQVLQKWGRYDEATICFQAGLVELQADMQPAEACQLYVGLSLIKYRQGSLTDALALATLGLQMARMQKDQRNVAYALQALGAIHWKQDDYAQAMQYYTDSLTLWQKSHHALGLAGLHNNLGLLYQSMGDLAQAQAQLEQARDLFEQVGNLHGLALVYDNLGEVYMALGKQDEAIQCVEQAVSILARIGLDETQVFSGMWKAGTW